MADLPPPFDCPISTDSGKKKEEGSTRNVREGSMAKWGCHVVDSKPRSAVSPRFFFFCLPNTLFYSARYCGLNFEAWPPWHAWSPRSLALPRRGWAPVTWRWAEVSHLTWQPSQSVQSSRPSSRVVRPLPLLPNELRTTTLAGGIVIRSACGTRICGWWLGPAPLEHCHIDGALIVVGRSSPGTPDHCPCLPSDELTGPSRQGHEPI